MIIHKKYIVNIFLKVSKELDDFKVFKDNINFWKEWCDNNNYKYILITDLNWKQYVDDKYYYFINNLRFVWNRIDFIRYCAINKLGASAIYIDLDMSPRFSLNEDPFIKYKDDYYIGCWYDKEKTEKYTNKDNYMACNQLFKMPRELSQKLIDYSMEQYHEKLKIAVYKTWIKRFMFQSTGAYMFCRFVKIHQLKLSSNLIYDEFDNKETKTWKRNFG